MSLSQRYLNQVESNNFGESLIEKINLKDYLIGENIFVMNNTHISNCKKIKTNKLYALKILNKSNLIKNNLVQRQYNEHKNLSNIYHPFILELKGINHTNPYNLYYL